MNKDDVEKLLGYKISDRLYKEALTHAKRKQAFLLKRYESKAPAEPWYLAKLTKECIHSILLCKETVDLCRFVYNIEKERLTVVEAP